MVGAPHAKASFSPVGHWCAVKGAHSPPAGTENTDERDRRRRRSEPGEDPHGELRHPETSATMWDEAMEGEQLEGAEPGRGGASSRVCQGRRVPAGGGLRKIWKDEPVTQMLLSGCVLLNGGASLHPFCTQS